MTWIFYYPFEVFHQNQTKYFDGTLDICGNEYILNLFFSSYEKQRIGMLSCCLNTEY